MSAVCSSLILLKIFSVRVPFIGEAQNFLDAGFMIRCERISLKAKFLSSFLFFQHSKMTLTDIFLINSLKIKPDYVFKVRYFLWNQGRDGLNFNSEEFQVVFGCHLSLKNFFRSLSSANYFVCTNFISN